jgi:hypothetical protein
VGFNSSSRFVIVSNGGGVSKVLGMGSSGFSAVPPPRGICIILVLDHRSVDPRKRAGDHRMIYVTLSSAVIKWIMIYRLFTD